MLDCKCITFWNDYLLNVPVIVLSMYAAYKLWSSFFRKKETEENEVFSSSSILDSVKNSDLNVETNWLNKISGNDLIEFKESICQNIPHSSESNAKSEDKSDNNNRFIKRMCELHAADISPNPMYTQIDDINILNDCVEKIRTKLIDGTFSGEGKISNFKFLNVVNCTTNYSTTLNVINAAKEKTVSSKSEHQGNGTMSKELIAADVAAIVDTIIGEVVDVTEEEITFDESRKHLKPKPCEITRKIGRSEEVSPATDSSEEVSPATDSSEEVSPATDSSEEVSPATDASEEVSPATDASEEVSPATETAQSTESLQNHDNLNILLSTANFYDNNFPHVPIEMIYNTLP